MSQGLKLQALKLADAGIRLERQPDLLMDSRLSSSHALQLLTMRWPVKCRILHATWRAEPDPRDALGSKYQKQTPRVDGLVYQVHDQQLLLPLRDLPMLDSHLP